MVTEYPAGYIFRDLAERADGTVPAVYPVTGELFFASSTCPWRPGYPCPSWTGDAVGSGFVMLVIAVVCFMLVTYLTTEQGRASRAGFLAARQARRRAAIKAKTITGPGWSLRVASLDSVLVTARVTATTAVTITNTSDEPARFEVSVVIVDADGTRLGTIKTLSNELAPRGSQPLVIQGRMSPLTTERFGRLDYRVVTR